MLQKLALVTTIAALAAYVWLLGSVFEPRVCIDSNRLQSLSLEFNGQHDAFLGHGVCQARGRLPMQTYSRITAFNADFSDLERFAIWIDRPFSPAGVRIEVSDHGDPKPRIWTVSRADWDKTTARRKELVKNWLLSSGFREALGSPGSPGSPRSSGASEVSEELRHSHALDFYAQFFALQIWGNEPSTQTEERPSGIQFSWKSRLDQDGLAQIWVNQLDRHVALKAKPIFYRAIIAALPKLKLVMEEDPFLVRQEVQMLQKESVLIAQEVSRLTPQRSVGGALSHSVLFDGVNAAERVFSVIEQLPVVIQFDGLSSSQAEATAREEVRGHQRWIEITSPRLGDALEALSSIHNRTILEAASPVALKEMLALQTITRKVLLLPRPAHTVKELAQHYETYFRLGPVAFASETKGISFVELSLPALELAIKRGADEDLRIRPGESFDDSQSQEVSHLVGDRAPIPLDIPYVYRFDSDVTPVEFFRVAHIETSTHN